MVELNFVCSRLNISLKDLWVDAYKRAKQQTPRRLDQETKEQYYRDLGISTLFEFADGIKSTAEELTRMAIDEDR